MDFEVLVLDPVETTNEALNVIAGFRGAPANHQFGLRIPSSINSTDYRNIVNALMLSNAWNPHRADFIVDIRAAPFYHVINATTPFDLMSYMMEHPGEEFAIAIPEDVNADMANMIINSATGLGIPIVA